MKILQENFFLNVIGFIGYLLIFAIASTNITCAQAADKKTTATKKTKLKGSGKALEYYEQAFKYSELEEYDKAIPLFVKAIDIDEKSPASKKSWLATVYGALAQIYRKNKQYDKAELFYLKAISTTERDLAEERHNLYQYYGNLGLLYYEQNKLDKAEKLFLKSLDYRFDSSGNEYMDFSREHVSNTCLHLADIYYDHKQYSKSESYYIQAIANKEQANSFDDLEAEYIYSKIAGLYILQGFNEKAEYIFVNKLLPVQEKVREADDPILAKSYNHLAFTGHLGFLFKGHSTIFVSSEYS